MIPKEQLAAWRAVTDAATEGPWEPAVWIETDGNEWRATGPGHDDRSHDHDSEPGCPDEQAAQCDATFIATARTAVPALLDEVERLRGERDVISAEVERWRLVVKAAKEWHGARCTRMPSCDPHDGSHDAECLLAIAESHLTNALDAAKHTSSSIAALQDEHDEEWIRRTSHERLKGRIRVLWNSGRFLVHFGLDHIDAIIDEWAADERAIALVLRAELAAEKGGDRG